VCVECVCGGNVGWIYKCVCMINFVPGKFNLGYEYRLGQ